MFATATQGGVYGPEAGPSLDMTRLRQIPAVNTTGQALSADSLASANTGMSVIQLGPWANHPVLGRPLTWWIGIVLVLVLYSWFEQKNLPEARLGIIKIGLGNLFRVGFLAVIFIVLVKMIFSKYQVPGLSDVFLAA